MQVTYGETVQGEFPGLILSEVQSELFLIPEGTVREIQASLAL